MLALPIELVARIRDWQPSLQDSWLCELGVRPTAECPAPEAFITGSSAVFDGYLDALQTGRADRLRVRAGALADRLSAGAATSESVLGLVLALRDVIARHLTGHGVQEAGARGDLLHQFERASNRLTISLASALLREQEQRMADQREASRVAWAPVLPLRERLLLLPVVGLMQLGRPRRLTEQVLVNILAHRARAVVLDLSNVPDVNREAATELLQTIDAARLLGAVVIVTGLSAEAAAAIDGASAGAGPIQTALSFQAGVHEAERILSRTFPCSAPDLPPATT